MGQRLRLEKSVEGGAWTPEHVNFLRGFCMNRPAFGEVWDKLLAGETVKIATHEFRLQEIVPEPETPTQCESKTLLSDSCDTKQPTET